MQLILGDEAALTSGSSDTLSITAPRDVHVTKLGFDATGLFKITGSDLQGKDDMIAASAAAPVYGRALADAGHPLELDEPLDLAKGESITFSVTDLSAADNKVGVVLIGTAPG